MYQQIFSFFFSFLHELMVQGFLLKTFINIFLLFFIVKKSSKGSEKIMWSHFPLLIFVKNIIQLKTQS